MTRSKYHVPVILALALAGCAPSPASNKPSDVDAPTNTGASAAAQQLNNGAAAYSNGIRPASGRWEYTWTQGGSPIRTGTVILRFEEDGQVEAISPKLAYLAGFTNWRSGSFTFVTSNDRTEPGRDVDIYDLTVQATDSLSGNVQAERGTGVVAPVSMRYAGAE